MVLDYTFWTWTKVSTDGLGCGFVVLLDLFYFLRSELRLLVLLEVTDPLVASGYSHCLNRHKCWLGQLYKLKISLI